VVLTYAHPNQPDFIIWTNAGYVVNTLRAKGHTVEVFLIGEKPDLSTYDQIIFGGHGSPGSCENLGADVFAKFVADTGAAHLERIHFFSCFAGCPDGRCPSLAEQVKILVTKGGANAHVSVGGGLGPAVIVPNANTNIIEDAWRVIDPAKWEKGGRELQTKILDKHGGKIKLDALARDLASAMLKEHKSLADIAGTIAALQPIHAFYAEYHAAFDAAGIYFDKAVSMKYALLQLKSRMAVQNGVRTARTVVYY